MAFPSAVAVVGWDLDNKDTAINVDLKTVSSVVTVSGVPCGSCKRW